MLQEEQLSTVKEEFNNTLRSIQRADCDIEGLIKFLEHKGFYEAPATKEYFCSFKGGLMLHSLNVYKYLVRLYKGMSPNGSNLTSEEKDTLIILGLLHLVYKSDLFTITAKNEKVYSNYGKKKDELGFFDWETRLGYKINDESNREIFGNNGFGTYFIVSGFIPLTKEESIILVNFNELLEDNTNKSSMYQVLSHYPLSSLLLSSSIMTSYYIENQYVRQDN